MNNTLTPFYFCAYFRNLFFLGLLIISSCKDNNTDASNKPNGAASSISDEDYYQFSLFKLHNNDIQGTIMLPNETARIGSSEIPKVKHKPGGFQWTVSVGKAFTLYFEDFGEDKSLVTKHRKKLNAQSNIYNVKYLESLPNLLIYKKTLKESAAHTSYHIYAQKKINGVMYEIKNKYSGDKKEVVMFMKKSIASFKSSI